MTWNPDAAISDFQMVLGLGDVDLPNDAVAIGAYHRLTSCLRSDAPKDVDP